jgi:hypothetical protein
VPVHLGTPDAADCIPAVCYIDARAFDSELARIEYLRGIDDSRFAVYQVAIAACPGSAAAQRSSNEQFTRMPVDTIAATRAWSLPRPRPELQVTLAA